MTDAPPYSSPVTFSSFNFRLFSMSLCVLSSVFFGINRTPNLHDTHHFLRSDVYSTRVSSHPYPQAGMEIHANERHPKRIVESNMKKRMKPQSLTSLNNLDDGCLMHIFSYLSPIPASPSLVASC